MTAYSWSSLIAKQSVSGRDGTDAVSNVEFLKFSDKTHDVDVFGNLNSHVNGDHHSDILLQNANVACYARETGGTGLCIKAGGFMSGYESLGADWKATV